MGFLATRESRWSSRNHGGASFDEFPWNPKDIIQSPRSFLTDGNRGRPPDKYTGEGDHFVLIEHTHFLDSFIDELDARDLPYRLVDPREDRSKPLYNQEYNVVRADPKLNVRILRVPASVFFRVRVG